MQAFIPTLFMARYVVSLCGMFVPKSCSVLQFHWIIIKPTVYPLPLRQSVLRISVQADRVMPLPTISTQYVLSFILKLAVLYQTLTCSTLPFKAIGI